ncbi:MAG TPA: GTPase domain-containing protein [Burkholderiaceae bacterium]|nr:GTPase domain-containing protein [Burkholderiaceae bacterium]
MSTTDEPIELSLSLVSHTNAGKTTLARTLLGREVGEVRDEAHVTDRVDAFALLTSSRGDRLNLWDTPGFGDSHRLLSRLALSGNPIGWLLTEVWDRFRDRAFWSSQQSIRHVRDSADVVLYLVNAAEDPDDATYVQAEMRILDWVGKPVIVLLNQLGAPREPAVEEAERSRWSDHLSGHAVVRTVLALDAFARCWVQESVLLDAVAQVLPPSRQAGFARLRAAWLAEQEAVFDESMRSLARRLARAALDSEPLAGTGLAQHLRAAGARVGLGRPAPDDARTSAMQALAGRLDTDVRQSTNELIAAHGLRGQARDEILARVASQFTVSRRVDEGRAAILGGLVSGSLVGLKADLATGGLTLGGGMVAGGLIGALSAAGLARGYNRIKGTTQDCLAWADEVLDDCFVAALLGYLVVAHFGRGRGEWDSPAAPAHWEPTVRGVVAGHRDALSAVWEGRRPAPADDAALVLRRDSLAEALQPCLEDCAREVLAQLYPDSPPTGRSSARSSAPRAHGSD